MSTSFATADSRRRMTATLTLPSFPPSFLKVSSLWCRPARTGYSNPAGRERFVPSVSTNERLRAVHLTEVLDTGLYFKGTLTDPYCRPAHFADLAFHAGELLADFLRVYQ
jgi:hypothetical protein